MVQTNIYLPVEIDLRLKKLGAKWKLSKSDTLQKIITMFFQEGGDSDETTTTN